ncbi:MAG: hypothetical protein WC763_02805 [Candidatus Paceibacterota bacterium]|jgi:hypothetical protein
MDILKGLNEEFGWFIWGIIAIGLIWIFTGGAQRSPVQAPYIKAPAPLDTGETYGKAYIKGTSDGKTTLNLPKAPAEIVLNAEQSIRDFFTQPSDAQKIHSSTLLSKTLSLDGTAGAKSSVAQEEYLRILAAPQAVATTSLAGMRIKDSAYDTNVTLPQAANLPILGAPYLNTDVLLPPASRAIVTSGRSPIGTSFRVNICTGYLNQFQTFTPDLRQDCPEPLDELKASGPYQEASCQDFVKELPRCRAFNGTFPGGLSAACRAFVTQNLNYNSCAQRNEGSEGFYKDEWRLFLDQTSELWRNSQEVIRLVDPKGNSIDAITY